MAPEAFVSNSRNTARDWFDIEPEDNDTDIGRHLTALRARARRPEPKSERNRSNDRRAAIRQSQRDS
jgi:hypothetical protein